MTAKHVTVKPVSPRASITPWATCVALAFAGVVLVGGCATVQPWERGRLSHRSMLDDTEPEAENMAQHEAGAREGALSPGASGGGGCGCN